MEKVGIFLSRMQPIHNAHLWLIENALKENDKVLIMIGSANKKGTDRNPLDITIRRKIVEEALIEKFGKNYEEKIKIMELPDWSTEKNTTDTEWGRLVYYNVVSNMDVKKFSYYCSEEPKLIKGWFDEYLKERINFRFFSRDNQFNGLSATKIREALKEDNIDYIKEYCPKCIYKNRKILKDIIKSAKPLA